MKYFGNKYDGTIIDENKLKKGKKYSKKDLEGASEIVIFEDFDELLEEIHEGGKKIKKNEKKIHIRVRKVRVRKIRVRKK